MQVRKLFFDNPPIGGKNMTENEVTSQDEVTSVDPIAEADKELVASILFIIITVVFLSAAFMIYHADPAHSYFWMSILMGSIGLIFVSFTVMHIGSFLIDIKIAKNYRTNLRRPMSH